MATTWEEIRDEVAGMLADGKPLEDVLAKLEKRKNEMAKANLLKAMDKMKKPKQITEQEYIQTCNTEQLAEVLFSWYKLGRLDVINKHTEIKKEWLIEDLEKPHREE